MSGGFHITEIAGGLLLLTGICCSTARGGATAVGDAPTAHVAATAVGDAPTAHGGATAVGDAPFYAATFEKTPSAAAMTSLGRELFFDKSLSASGMTSCASCHDPRHEFAAPNASAVQLGGADGLRPGVRAVPSLMYTQSIPPFTEHYVDDEGDDSVDQGPAGGRTWDGRARSAHEQAMLPLLSPFEMANRSAADVVAKLQRGPRAALMREDFGPHLFDHSALAFKAVLMALETFQQSPDEFYPYTSKYDAWLRHETALNAQEMRGLQAFNDPARGNCARCHPSSIRHGAFPLFTDFGFAAVGAPRNRAIPANEDPAYYDLGLCGPLRTDLTEKQEYCGLFRTPSLRNAAKRQVFFHNGVFRRLEDVVRFYAERDAQPQKFYKRAPDGVAMKFDDLPREYWSNVDRESPLDRDEGGQPAFGEAEIREIVAFLNTLTDGFTAPSAPSAPSEAR